MKLNKTSISSTLWKIRMNSKLFKVSSFFLFILLISFFALCSSLFGFNTEEKTCLVSKEYQELIVYNLVGNEVERLQRPIDDTKLFEDNFEDLRTGFYLVEVKTTADSIVKSLVID